MSTRVLSPAEIYIGPGTVRQAGAALRTLGVGNPLVITDRFLMESGHIMPMLDSLAAEGICGAIFDGVRPDPTSTIVAEALAHFHSGRHDSLVAFGGGSPIDTAKAVNLCAATGKTPRELKVPAVADRRAVPLLAIPTTAGTGSEVTRFTVVTDAETNEKMLIAGPACVPTSAIVDYELTLSAPFRLTADTAIDSLTHAIEAYVSRRRNPYSQGMAVLAMRAIARHIRQACFHPDDRGAREALMLAATQAGLAFSNASVCLVHGMSRPLGAYFHVAHGLSNAMLLPAVTRFSLPGATAEYAQCARETGWAGAGDEDTVAARRLVEGLEALNRDLAVPSPRQYGIPRPDYFDMRERMAQQALASGSPGNNPRVPALDEIVALYEEVYDAGYRKEES